MSDDRVARFAGVDETVRPRGVELRYSRGGHEWLVIYHSAADLRDWISQLEASGDDVAEERKALAALEGKNICGPAVQQHMNELKFN